MSDIIIRNQLFVSNFARIDTGFVIRLFSWISLKTALWRSIEQKWFDEYQETTF